MKEGLLSHMVPDGEAGQERTTGGTSVLSNQTARALGLALGPAETLTTERSEELLGKGTEAFTVEPAAVLSREPAESPTRERTEEPMGERSEELLVERPEEPMGERTEGLAGERTEGFKRKRTESLRSEDAEDILDNGLEGTSEASILLESKAPSITADLEELPPAAPNCAEEPPKGAGGDEPPVDWLEPLEEDDDDDDEEEDRKSWEMDLLPGERRLNGRREAEDESLGGESEMSGSVGGSERNSAPKACKIGLVVPRRRRRRQQALVDEEWEDCPVLGEGWRRREVFRRSGFTVGKTDTYYLSPEGERFRSKIELAKYLAGSIDLSGFDFKSGIFSDVKNIRRSRKVTKYQKVGHSVENTPDFVRTPYRPRSAPPKKAPPPLPLSEWPGDRSLPLWPATPPRPISTPPRPAPPHLGTPPRSAPLRLSTLPGPTPPFAPSGLSSTPHSPLHHVGRLRLTLKQEAGPPDCTQPELPAPGCKRCGAPVPPREVWRKRRSSLCLKCKAEKRKHDSSNIVFRKWLPCGQCRACLVTEDCGMCASCRNGLLKRDSRKPVRCRKRKCLCPIRKKSAKERLAEKDGQKPVKLEETYMAPVEVRKVKKLEKTYMAPVVRKEVRKVKPCSVNKRRDSEVTICIEGEDEDVYMDMDEEEALYYEEEEEEEYEDEDEAVFLSRLGRPCGWCVGCLRSADCGYCDRCAGRPGLSPRPRAHPPCRLRLCQNPVGLVQRLAHEGWMGLGSPRPHYSSHWTNNLKRKALWEDLDYSDEEEDEEDVAGAGRPGDDKLQQDGDRDGGVWTSQNCFKADSRRVNVVNENKSPAGVPDTQPSSDSAPVEGEEPDAEAPVAVDAGSGVPWEPELQALLDALRKMALPHHWVGLMGEGPSLRVLQCSRRSTMADTSLLIDSGFYYQISVQGQPLLLTHALYRDHPRRLPTVPHVVALLLDLERYAVCQGCPSPAPPPSPARQRRRARQRFVPQRAAVCHFLVLKTEERCVPCRSEGWDP